MKFITTILLLSVSLFSFSQDVEKVKTEAEIIEITFHQGKRIRETATVKFNLEDGTEQMGNIDLFRVPFIGSMTAVGDKINVRYNKDNPVMVESVFGSFLSTYGMYILILLGIIFSLKPILNYRKSLNKNR